MAKTMVDLNDSATIDEYLHPGLMQNVVENIIVTNLNWLDWDKIKMCVKFYCILRK